MDLERLVSQNGEWLRGAGPESDIVISSRIRLARNLADFPFCPRASSVDKREIQQSLRKCVAKVEKEHPLFFLDLKGLGEIDRNLLVERHLISRELAQGDGPRAACISPTEDISLMFNEEDHLRIQVLRSAFSLRECWDIIDQIDDQIESQVRYAYDEELGYLTACPTNVGTGIRASVMLHLPALAMTKQIEKVFRALQKMHLTARGLYGEGSQASGDLYQISNNITLGKTELELIDDINAVVKHIVDYERRMRKEMVNHNRQTVHDRVSRAYGILMSAQTITSEETMHHLSSLRMGVNLELIAYIDIHTVNDLFIHTQPAHLQKIERQALESEKRNIARATYLRRRLSRSFESMN